jgi:hypothetical protein
MIGIVALLGMVPRRAAADLSDEGSSMRTKPSVIDTIQNYCRMLTADKFDVVAAAQRFGMHLVDEKLAVTFTPRDRGFSRGVALRTWRTNDLGGFDLDVEPTIKLPFSKLRDAFGPFKFSPRMHPGDDYELMAFWRPPDAKRSCGIVASLRAHTEHPTGHEAVWRVSLTR